MKIPCIVFLVLILIEVSGVLGVEPRGIAELLKALEGEDAQFEALQELEDLGLDAAPAVASLIQLLDAPDSGIRSAAADVLGAIGKDAAAAIPKLIERLGEGELPRVSTEVGNAFSAVGIRAASALGRMGQEAVAPLDRALADKNSLVRSNAACALEDIGPAARAAVPSLIRLLKDRDDLVRERAIFALREINTDAADTVPALVACLTDENFNIRVAATSALGAIRPMTPAAVEGLIRALRDEEGDVQHEAADALGKLGADAITAIPDLTNMLKIQTAYRYSHPVLERPVAGTAARALGALGPRAKEAVPALLDLIRDTKGTFERYGPDDKCDNYEARREAAIAAAKINPQNDDLVRVLGQSLEEDDWIRGEVAVALAIMGPKAKDMVPLLVRFTKPDPRFSNELECACALVAIEPNNSLAVQQMLDYLPPKPGEFTEDDWDMLRTALVRAGTRSRPAIPTMIKEVADCTADQENAARTLATFGPEAQSAIPALIELLASRWEHPRQEAIAALQQIASEKSAPLLVAFKCRDANVRSGVVEVLGHFPGAVPLITESLNDRSARVRLAALLALANLKGIAEPAIPQIRALLPADSRTIREAAALALQTVEQH
jgi:HEAT repeat protein